jgi:hypothetical protein
VTRVTRALGVSQHPSYIAKATFLLLVGGCDGSFTAPDEQDEVTLEPCGSGSPVSVAIRPHWASGSPAASSGAIPVWRPPQGGTVVGLEIQAFNAVQLADSVELSLSDADGGKPWFRHAWSAAWFACSQDVALWDLAMLDVSEVYPDADALMGRSVHVEVVVHFVRASGVEPAFASASFTGVFADANQR